MPSNRREFLKTSAASLTALSALTATGAADRPNEKIVMAVMGVRNRGKDLLHGFSAFEDVEIAYVCDVDENVVPAALKAINARQKKMPKVEKDIRKVLEDKQVTAMAIAAPDHWHALATIWACQAGKDVYVEKPISHDIVEGRRMIQAARRYNRVVAVGTQRRSSVVLGKAVQFLRDGGLGKVYAGKAVIYRPRDPIGVAADSQVPQGVHYDLW